MEKKDKDEDSKIFPQRLMEILGDERSAGIIEWLPHGRAFVVKDRAAFADRILPVYFSRQAKYSSFTRKLNRWNFVRVASGPEIGALYHEFFLRDKPHLTAQMYCKNARSKHAMSDEATPHPTAATVNSGCAAAAASDGPVPGGHPHVRRHHPAEKSDLGRANPPLLRPPHAHLFQGGVAGSAADPRLAGAARGMLPPDAAAAALSSSATSYSLPPDIPLALLEVLSKGGPPDLATSAASAAAQQQQGPVPSRLLQQSQYANLLLERQIQILQQEQAKYLMMRQTLAARQQHQMQQQQQQQQMQHHQHHMPQYAGPAMSAVSGPTRIHPGLMGPLAVPPPLPSLPPSAAASSASSSELSAAAAPDPSAQPPLSVASALEHMRREDEERLCQLINLRLERERSLREQDPQGSQPPAKKNPRASAA